MKKKDLKIWRGTITKKKLNIETVIKAEREKTGLKKPDRKNGSEKTG